MNIQKIYGNHGQVLAILEDYGNEKRITTQFGRTLGRYYEHINRTYDANDKLVGEGNLLMMLMAP